MRRVAVVAGWIVGVGLMGVVLAEDSAPSTAPASGDTGGVGVTRTATQLEAAKKILAKTQADFDQFVSARKAEFEAGEEYVAAKKAVEEDEKVLSAAQAPIREKLRASNEQYASAVGSLDDTKKKYEEALASRKPDEISFRKVDLARKQDLIAKAEAPLFAADATVVAAQAKLDEDRKVLAGMQRKFGVFLGENPDYQALSKAVANARARVATLSSRQ